MRKIGSWLGKWWSSQDSHILDLLRGASKAGALKVISGVFSIGLSVMLGRVLGAESTGAYFLVLTVATVAATVGRLGLDSAVVRVVAGHATASRWLDVAMTQRVASAIGVNGSLIVASLIFFAAETISRTMFGDVSLATPMRIMAIAIIPLSVGALLSRSLLGLTRIRESIMVISILPYGVALIGTWLLARSWGLLGAIVGYIVALVIALAYGFVVWKRALSGHEKVSNETDWVPHLKCLLGSVCPLLIGAILQLVLTMSGLLMLGVLADKTEVSLFAVAWRTALLITFVLLAVNTIAQPKFAELFARRDMMSLEKAANRATVMMSLFAAPIFLVIFCAPKFVMSAFGTDFLGGATTLQFLAVGQFVNVAAGSVGILLLMSGHEREYRNVQIVVACVIVILNLLLIPTYGAIGAAIAAATALILQNILFGYYVWARLGILMIKSHWHRK